MEVTPSPTSNGPARAPEAAWDAAIHIVKRLRESGHRALLAGGCVRDRLLNLVPKDFDVATDALPSRVAELFRGSRLVGAKFGVVLVRKFGVDTEVATFRSDGQYTDGRRPDSVTYGTEREDALRRDFTINGLYYDPSTDEIIDHVGGTADLRARVLRTIGDPELRFAEDHLRLLRAVRFAARFDLTIAPATLSAIRANTDRLTLVSAERVYQEIEAILTAPTRERGWRLLLETGLRANLTPAWTAIGSEDEHVARRMAQLPAEVISPSLAFAAAIHPRMVGVLPQVCTDLRLSNRNRADVQWLVETLALALTADRLQLADVKQMMTHAEWTDLLAFVRAEDRATNGGDDRWRALFARVEQIPVERVAPPPLLNGHDLAAMGIPAGPTVGAILTEVRRAQLNEAIHTGEEARNLARALFENRRGE